QADDIFAAFLAHQWGPVFLRPIEETQVTMHDKHPQRMMRDMLKMTHQIFEPIRMSKEEGNLSRSVTTRAPPAHLARRKAGAGRASRDFKNGPISPEHTSPTAGTAAAAGAAAAAGG